MKSHQDQNSLPNLVIIGAMKCGTTSLHQYLNLHPEISMSQMKELDFFIEGKNWERGLEWYKSQFKENTKVIGEASPNYTKYHVFPNVAQRMGDLIPDAKLIYLVRDPIQRITSHYLHQVIARAEHRSFDEVFSNLNNNHYVMCSLYAEQLKQFMPYYSLSNILVVSLEDLARNRLAVLKRIFQFLSVCSDFQHPEFSSILHRSSDKQRLTKLGESISRLPMGMRLLNLLPFKTSETIAPPEVSISLKQELMVFLAKDAEQLRQLTNNSFTDWAV